MFHRKLGKVNKVYSVTINKKKIKKFIKIALIVLVIVALLNFVYTPTSEAKVGNDLVDACAEIVSTLLDGLMGLLFWPFRLLILLMGKGLEVLLGFFVIIELHKV